MTIDEVKGIFETVATTLETVKMDYSQSLSEGIVKIISNLKEDDIIALAFLFETPVETIKTNVASVLKIIKGLDRIFLTDECDKIAAFCRKMESRSIILKFIGWKLG